MRRQHSYLYRNGLSFVFLVFFLGTLAAQVITGWKVHNQELEELNAKPMAFSTYLQTGHFISATFENFESEFLQMALYVLMTIKLRQLGSAESKSLDEKEEVTIYLRQKGSPESKPVDAPDWETGK